MKMQKRMIAALLVSAFAIHAGADSKEQREVLNKAHNHFAKGEFNKAIEKYEESVEYFRFEASRGLANSYLALGKKVEALKVAKGILAQEEPYNLDNRVILTRIYRDLEDYASAEKEINLMLLMRPKYVPAMNLGGLIAMDQFNWEKAITNFSAVIVDNPTNVEARFNRAKCFIGKQDFAAAAKDLDVINDLPGVTAEQRHMLADVNFGLKKLPEVEQVLTKSEKEFGNTSEEYLWRMGQLRIWQGRANEGLELLKKAVQVAPNNFSMKVMVSKVYINARLYADAETQLLSLHAARPEVEEIVKDLLFVLDEQKAFDRKGAFLVKYTERYPEKTWAIKAYADLLVYFGQKEMAAKFVSQRVGGNSGAYVNEVKEKILPSDKGTEKTKVTELSKYAYPLGILNSPNIALPPQIKINQATASVEDKSPVVDTAATTHDMVRVGPGDTLTSISQKYYGTHQKVGVILEANSELLKTADDVVVGMVLKVPKQKSLRLPTALPSKKKQ
jgi:tetratricopeptide (TPR) repeat protein